MYICIYYSCIKFSSSKKLPSYLGYLVIIVCRKTILKIAMFRRDFLTFLDISLLKCFIQTQIRLKLSLSLPWTHNRAFPLSRIIIVCTRNSKEKKKINGRSLKLRALRSRMTLVVRIIFRYDGEINWTIVDYFTRFSNELYSRFWCKLA